MSIYIPQPQTYNKKLESIQLENLRIVSDFDSTITTHTGHSSWSLLSSSGLMPVEYINERNALKETYYPYEISHDISEEERRMYMKTWWTEHLKLLSKYKLQKHHLENIVSHEMQPREGLTILFEKAQKHQIPFLILSAGIKESIEIVLEHKGVPLSPIDIAANSLTFDTDGFCIGFSHDMIIHAANKDEYDIPESIESKYLARHFAILMGDSLDDMKMIREQDRESIMAVGFLTSNRLHQRERFHDTFDVVIESDTSDLGFFEGLFEQLESKNQKIS